MSTRKAGANATVNIRREVAKIEHSARDFARFEKMSFRELADYAHHHEVEAMKARYALWKRHELNHRGN